MQDESGERLPYFGAPPSRTPRPARSVPTLRGKRVVLSTPEGFVYDMRAISEIYTHPDGHDVIDIATEEDYYRWMFSQTSPRRQSFPSHLVWIE